MKAKQLATLALALSAATANAAFVGVEDFQAYTTGNVGTSSAFESNDGPWTGWTGTSSNTGSSLIGLSAQSDGNKYLRYGWTSGARGAYLNTAPAISNTQAGIYYFQALLSQRSALGLP